LVHRSLLQAASLARELMTSVLALAPDPDELAAILGEFSRRRVASTTVRVGAITCTHLTELNMLFAVGGNGKTEYGIKAQYLIDRCERVSLLVCVGTAGRLSDAVAVGDVIVATATVEHDYKRRISPKPPPRHDGDRRCLEEFLEITKANEFPFRVHLGIVASGDEDIIDRSRAREVRALTDALCVAWEGSGGARAARLNGIGFVEIRGISDGADADTRESFRQNLEFAMSNVTQLLLAWHGCRKGAI
jgi:adenosylhomocysteine nucleosidase